MTPDRPALPPVCVLGLGLIGGSLLRATAPATTGYGWSRSAETRAAAEADGYQVVGELDDVLRRAAADDALVVLAAPVTAFPALLRSIESTAPGVRLTDVASVKTLVADQVAELAPSSRYVGSHPMAGTQHSGWEAGTPDLFAGAAWVTCLTDDTSIADWSVVARLALAVGSRVVPADPESHDDAVARISHLPHILALALAQVGADGGALALSLAASSFADGTRVAGTRPELIRAMCEANRGALTDALDNALGLIGVARASLASTGSLQRITVAGYDARQQFDQRSAELVPLELDGDDLIDQLLAVGSTGGQVVGIDGPHEAPSVHALAPPDLL